MNEKYLFTEQIDRLSKSAPGLTSLSQGGYAVYGEIFMSDVSTAEKREPTTEVNVVNQDEIRTANEHTPEQINEALAANKVKLDSDEQVKLETEKDAELVGFLQSYGISPEQFNENPEFFRQNKWLFKDKLKPEQVSKLIRIWKKHFESHENGEVEFNVKFHVIFTLAVAAGLTPKAFARQFKWDSFFDIPQPATPVGIIKQIFKDVILEIVAGVAVPADDPNKTPEENRVIKQQKKEAFAKVLWGAKNRKKEEKKEPISHDEKTAQKHAIEIGALPDLVANINSTLETDDERISEAEKLLGMKLTDRQKTALISAHKIGKGQKGKDGTPAKVFNFTDSQIAEKAWILKFGVEDAKSTDPIFTREQRRMLMEAGLAGEAVGDSQESEIDRNEQDNRRIAKAILDGLTPFQRQTIDDIRVVIENRNIPLDLTDPSITASAAELARKLPEGTRITAEQIDEFINRKLAEMNQVINEVRREGLVTNERQQAAKNAWDEMKRERINAGEPLTEDEIRKIESWIRLGKFPNEVSWQTVSVESQREESELVARAWAEYEDLRNSQNQPFTDAERLRVAQAIRRGEMPPMDFIHPEEPIINENISEDIGARGHRTFWEELQDLHMQRKRQLAQGMSPTDRNFISMSVIEAQEQNKFEHPTPNSVEDLAWLIGKSAPDYFGVLSNKPVWEVVYTRNGTRADGTSYKAGERVMREDELYDDEITEGRVNKGNFISWLRDRMMYMHGDEPDDGIDFEKEITVERGGWGTINMGAIRKNPGRYLRRESVSRKKTELEQRMRNSTGSEKDEIRRKISELPDVVMTDLLDEIKRETWAFTMTRNYDLNYRARSGNKDDFTKMMIEIFARSPFTKTVWDGRSLFDWVFTMDQEYGKDDHKVGAALVGAYQIYYNLTDTEKLREFMGDGAKLLLTRAGLKDARDTAAGINLDRDGKASITEKFNVNGEYVRRVVEKTPEEVEVIRKNMLSDSKIDDLFYYTGDQAKKMQEIYREIARRGFDIPHRRFVRAGVDSKGEERWQELDEKGQERINEWRYIKAFNFNSSPQISSEPSLIIRTAIQKYITDKYDLKVRDAETGEMIVDTKNVEFAELFANTMNRWTGAQARNNHTAAGYDAWVALMKTRTYRRKYSESNRSEAFGNPYTVDMLRSLISDLMTGIRTETPITEEERKSNSRYADRSEKAFKAPIEIMEEMLKAWDSGGTSDERSRKYAATSRQHKYLSNTLKYFGLDQIKRGMDIYNQIIDAQEIKLEKFTRIDPLKGITFERDQFQAAVQDKFLKPMRYMLSTWSQVDMGMTVRESRGDEAETAWVEITMAEKMFGKEVIDIPEFWEKVMEGTPGAQRFSTRDKEGVFRDTWRIPHKISGKEVNDNRVQLIKQVAKTRIAAELYSHVDLHSSDPRYDFRFYETIISALEKLPGGIEGDEFDMKSAKTILDPDKRYFSKEDIDWIRKKSKTTRGRLFGFELLRVLISEVLIKGSADAFKTSSKFITKGLM